MGKYLTHIPTGKAYIPSFSGLAYHVLLLAVHKHTCTHRDVYISGAHFLLPVYAIIPYAVMLFEFSLLFPRCTRPAQQLDSKFPLYSCINLHYSCVQTKSNIIELAFPARTIRVMQYVRF